MLDEEEEEEEDEALDSKNIRFIDRWNQRLRLEEWKRETIECDDEDFIYIYNLVRVLFAFFLLKSVQLVGIFRFFKICWILLFYRIDEREREKKNY